MFIEFLDQLRCTNEHEDSWLVAAFHRRRDRFILDATLGCPVCGREYSIVDGVAYFGVTPRNERGDDPNAASPDRASTVRLPVDSNQHGHDDEPDDDTALRAAALLNARERATLVLGGEWGDHAHTVSAFVPMRLFALDPNGAVDDSESVGVIRSSQGIPLTPASVDGVALDARTATERNVATALRVLKAGGRLVAPADIPLPQGIEELARDGRYWVGATVPSIVPMTLRRATLS